MTSRTRYTPERIVGMLAEAEVRLSQGENVGSIRRSLGISEVRKLRQLEAEDGRLRRLVAELH